MSSRVQAHADFFEALPIDPFSADPTLKSCIPGLGGDVPSPDPSYAFRSVAVRPALGPVSFHVIVQHLIASRGNLLLEVKAVSAFPGADPVSLTVISVSLAELAAAGGSVEVPFISQRNTLYLIEGTICDETDITSSGISLSIDRRAKPEEHGRGWAAESEPVPEKIGRMDNAMITSWLTKLTPPTFEQPSSQPWTARQSRTAACRSLVSSLGTADIPETESWPEAFVLQSLEAYGALGKGAAGIGFSAENRPIVSAMASRRCDVLATAHVEAGEAVGDPGVMLADLWRPEICDADTFYDFAHFTTCDYLKLTSGFYRKFDFMWSINVNRLLGRDSFIYFVLNSMICLRSEGLAVHVFDFSDRETNNGQILDRHATERLVLLAISHLNQVAPLKFRAVAVPLGATGSVPFGLIVRRGKEGDQVSA